jgi:hypothetical protein
MKHWTPIAIDTLLHCCELGCWFVDTANLVSSGYLIGLGLLDAHDDYEGPQLTINEAGHKYALRKKWIVSAPDALYEPYQTTELGELARKGLSA